MNIDISTATKIIRNNPLVVLIVLIACVGLIGFAWIGSVSSLDHWKANELARDKPTTTPTPGWWAFVYSPTPGGIVSSSAFPTLQTYSSAGSSKFGSSSRFGSGSGSGGWGVGLGGGLGSMTLPTYPPPVLPPMPTLAPLNPTAAPKK